MGISSDIVRHADACRDMTAKETAVIQTDDRRKNRVFIVLPCIHQIRMPFLDVRLADRQGVLTGIVFFLVAQAVDAGKVRNHRIIPEFIGVIYSADAQCRQRIGDFFPRRFIDDRDVIVRLEYIAWLRLFVIVQIRRTAIFVRFIPVHIAVCISVEFIIVYEGFSFR